MKESKGKRRTKLRIQPDWRWITSVFGATIGISAAMSLVSNGLLSGSGIAVSFLILMVIILLGIVFDIIGVAVTAAEERPFHSMAAKKVPEAKEALNMLRRADRVSSFCNDVVGDICGVISGSASAVIATQAVVGLQPLWASAVQLLMSAVVAGLTVGGKAFGKSLAMQNATAILHTAARLIYAVKSVPRRLAALIGRG
ncbi:MAG TPA: hypothetical protein IAA67_02050 [Candidatus Avoscillospira stercorigallinarum]|uniref:CNNM transmembrane domain-containing protein n=1 Tax=Candidatus Avoscillospira stercorigallinarum TaxID=2840708 RepID=A0A9D0Z575_9FIRM|nr:hypothetical protein [Candidatus Avoscillospira stercorigallinarum]